MARGMTERSLREQLTTQTPTDWINLAASGVGLVTFASAVSVAVWGFIAAHEAVAYLAAGMAAGGAIGAAVAGVRALPSPSPDFSLVSSEYEYEFIDPKRHLYSLTRKYRSRHSGAYLVSFLRRWTSSGDMSMPELVDAPSDWVVLGPAPSGRDFVEYLVHMRTPVPRRTHVTLQLRQELQDLLLDMKPRLLIEIAVSTPCVLKVKFSPERLPKEGSVRYEVTRNLGTRQACYESGPAQLSPDRLTFSHAFGKTRVGNLISLVWEWEQAAGGGSGSGSTPTHHTYNG